MEVFQTVVIPAIRLSDPSQRPLAPFVQAIAQELPGGRQQWRRLAMLADWLDLLFGAWVTSVRTSRYSELGGLLFIIGDLAFAIEPLTEVTKARVYMASATSKWFAPSLASTVDEDKFGVWMASQCPAAPAERPATLERYRGPRIFGENFLVDELLPTILEGCTLL